MPARASIGPIQWFAVLTAAFAGGGAIIELGNQPWAWSVFVQSAIGLAAAALAYGRRRLGGRLGVLWGIGQAIVITVDGSGWVGRQFLATYIGTRSTNPAASTGTVIAVNAIGGFFACVWGWFLLKERWRGEARDASSRQNVS
jgi:hypothetical protein